MRIALPFVLLLFGVSSAKGQAQTSGAVVESTVPASVQAPVQPLPAAAPAPALPKESTQPQATARTEESVAAQQAEAQEPKKRSRLVWFLVGAVVVLGIIVATS